MKSEILTFLSPLDHAKALESRVAHEIAFGQNILRQMYSWGNIHPEFVEGFAKETECGADA